MQMIGTLGLLRIQDWDSQGKQKVLLFFRHTDNKSQTPLAYQAWHLVPKFSVPLGSCTSQLHGGSFNGGGVSLESKESLSSACQDERQVPMGQGSLTLACAGAMQVRGPFEGEERENLKLTPR